jgi:hypothetical protein
VLLIEVVLLNIDLSDVEIKLIKIIGDNVKYPPESGEQDYKENNQIEGISYKNKDTIYTYLLEIVPPKEVNKLLRNLYLKGLICFSKESSSYSNNCFNREKIDPVINHKYNEEIKNQDGIIRLTNKKERVISGQDIYDYIIREDIIDTQQELVKNYNILKETINNNSQESVYTKIIGIFTILLTTFALIVGNMGIFRIIEISTYQEVMFIGIVTNAIIVFILLTILLSLKYLIFKNKETSFRDYLLLLSPIFMFLAAVYIIVSM